MILQVIGWLALAFVLGSATLAWLLTAFNGLGTWNIGGVPNTASTRVTILCVGAAIGYLWYELFANSPFTITVTRIAS